MPASYYVSGVSKHVHQRGGSTKSTFDKKHSLQCTSLAAGCFGAALRVGVFQTLQTSRVFCVHNSYWKDKQSKMVCGTIELTIKKCINLKNVQTIGEQDPYVEVNLLPWGDQVKKTSTLSGINPEWKKNNTFELLYYGTPREKQPAELLLRVMDKEVTRSNRPIGETKMNVRHLVRQPNVRKTMTLELKDEDGVEAGKIEIEFEFLLKGSLCLKINQAKALREVQTIGSQSPYLIATLYDDSAFNKPESGINPMWDTSNVKNQMMLRYEGRNKDDEPPVVNVTCFDKEMLQKDRIIGSGQLKVYTIINANGKPYDTEVKLNLKGPNGEPSGVLKGYICFINDAYDASKEVAADSGSGGMTRLTSFKSFSDLTGVSSQQLDAGVVKDFGLDFFFSLERSIDMEVVDLIAKKTHIPKVYLIPLLYFGGFSTAMFFWVKFGTKLLQMAVAIAYPCYASFKALESVDKEDDTQWLTYWVIYAVMHLLEESVLLPVAYSMPMVFYVVKMIFVSYLIMPQFKGANFIYERFVAPILKKHEEKIDYRLSMAFREAEKVSDKIKKTKDAAEALKQE